MSQELSQARVLEQVKQLYHSGRFLRRKVQHLRPYICPFDRLLALVPPGATVLDIGCGAGLFLGLLAVNESIQSGVGFDADRAAIALAGEMTQALNVDQRERLHFEWRDVRDPWPDGEFDVVSLIDVMHHVPPAAQKDVLRQAAGKVKAGGLLLYKDMARRPFWWALANRLHDLVMARQWIHYLPIEQARRWGVELGLQVQHEDVCRMFWYAHELIVFRKG